MIQRKTNASLVVLSEDTFETPMQFEGNVDATT